MAINKLSAFRGDTYTLNIKIENDAGPINITGWTLFFTLKEKVTDPDFDALISKIETTHTNAAAGESLFVLFDSETDDLVHDYFWDVQWKKPDGSIKTIAKGIITFDTDVTIRTS